MRNQVQAKDIPELKNIAVAFAESGAFPDVKTAAQAFVKIMAGQEYGLGPMAAMQGIYYIKDKPALAAVTIAGCIKKSGVYDFRTHWLTRKPNVGIVRSEDPVNDFVAGCEVEFYQGGSLIGSSTFTDDDVAAASLSSNANYTKYKRNMLFSRALTNGARWYCSDVFSGSVYTPDELNENIEIDALGRPVEATPMSAPNVAIAGGTEPPADARAPLSLKALVAKYEVALPWIPDNKDLKLSDWLEREKIAPGIKTRKDAVTNRQIPPSREELLAAEDALQAIITRDDPTKAEAEPEPAKPVEVDPLEAAAAFEEPAPEAPATVQHASNTEGPFAGTETVPTESQMRRIQAMFSERTQQLAKMFPIAKNAGERRHTFASNALGDTTKGSSKTWNRGDYDEVSKALEKVPVNE